MNDDVRIEIWKQIAGKVPGLAVTAVTANSVLFSQGFGQAYLALDQPMTPATVCNWFSMTKLVTATAVIQLVDDGLLDLDAPVAVLKIG